MPKLYETFNTQDLGPFDNASMLAVRLTTSLIMNKACCEVAQLEYDVTLGLDDLDLPKEVRAQVMSDYAGIKERWSLLFSSPLCVD